jgi:adenine-specific DNA-methyltransferase
MDLDLGDLRANRKLRRALSLALGFSLSKLNGDEPFLISEETKTASLFNPDELELFVERGEDQSDKIETVYLPFAPGAAFTRAKAQLDEAWPSLTKTIEIRHPLKEGFEANLDYFRLDFLDRARAEIGGRLADILPALWMMAGCRGKLPTCRETEKMLFFKDCPFAILVEESAIKLFLAKLEEREDIDWVFIVTNDQDSFSRICEWMPEHIPATQQVHLWRNYTDNFLINVERNGGEKS